MTTNKDARTNEAKNVIVAREISFATKKELRTKSRAIAREVAFELATKRLATSSKSFSFVRSDKSRVIARIEATNETIIDNYDSYSYFVRLASESDETRLDKRNFYRYALNENLVIVVASDAKSEED